MAGWFDSSRAVRQRRAIWGTDALDTLEQLLTSDTAIWETLGLDGAELEPFVLAPERAVAVRAELRLNAVAALINEISRGSWCCGRPGKHGSERAAGGGSPA